MGISFNDDGMILIAKLVKELSHFFKEIELLNCKHNLLHFYGIWLVGLSGIEPLLSA